MTTHVFNLKQYAQIVVITFQVFIFALVISVLSGCVSMIGGPCVGEGTCSGRGLCEGTTSCDGTGTCEGYGECQGISSCTGTVTCDGVINYDENGVMTCDGFATCDGIASCDGVGLCEGKSECEGIGVCKGSGACSGQGTCLPLKLAAERAPCMTGEKGPGSSSQQECLQKHIPGFGGWHPETYCTMIAYLTDQEQEESAREILRPFFKEMRPECGRNATVKIRKGQYEFTELSEWSSEAFDLLKNLPGVKSVGGIPFYENRVRLYLESEDTTPRVKQVLLANEIPFTAFSVASEQAEKKAKLARVASFSTAPEIRYDDSGPQVVIPAVRWGGDKAAEVTMGETSLDEVLKMLPPFPGHGPQKPSGKVGASLSAEIQEVLRNVTLSYNPAKTQTIVSFDRNNKLIFVQNMIEREQAERFAGDLDAMVNMIEVRRDSKRIVKDGKLTPCVLVQTTAVIDEKNIIRVNQAAYFFTCETS